MGLTLLASTSLPIQIWGEPFTTIMHIINALTYPVIHNKSPHEMIFNTVPDYEKIQNLWM